MSVSVAQARLTIEVLRASYISSRDKRCTTYLLLTETTFFPLLDLVSFPQSSVLRQVVIY